MHDYSDQQISYLAKILQQQLKQQQACLCTAESCTGGWVAKAMTDHAGSSDIFDGSFVTYSNQAKQQLLGVKPSILDSYGAVSVETTQAMLHGALQRAPLANIALSISGIAGPSGGSQTKPVGTVCFSWGSSDNFSNTRQCFSGDREAVRRQAVVYGLQQLIDFLA